MDTNIDIASIQDEAYAAIDALDSYITNSSIPKALQELIKVRASQLNGCSYCIDAHSYDAMKAGVTMQKVLLVSGWKKAKHLFTPEEQITLRLTEELTKLGEHGIQPDTVTAANALLGKQMAAQITVAISLINLWNRIGVSANMSPRRRNEPVINNN